DCDGTIDNGFGYPTYATQTANCGSCGNVCSFRGAVAKCQADMNGQGSCLVDHCINDGSDTYRHNPSSGNRDVTGCEVHCPLHSSTTTSGSHDCDDTACTFAAETCNGID